MMRMALADANLLVYPGRDEIFGLVPLEALLCDTPVIVAGRIFLTAEPDALVCVDRQEGKVLWSKNHGPDTLPPEIRLPEKKPRTVDGCGYATPTPVSDGRLVYVVFGTGIVAFAQSSQL